MSNQHKPQTLNKDNFRENVLEAGRPALVDFWADWCAPCQAVAPVVQRVADHFGDQLTVGKVNVDDEPELAESYGIRSIPALLVVRDGKVVDQIAGAVPFGRLSESIERVLSAH